MEEKLDGRVHRTSAVKGDVAIIPAGTPVEFRSRERAPQEVESLAVRLGPMRRLEPLLARLYARRMRLEARALKALLERPDRAGDDDRPLVGTRAALEP